LAGDGIGKLHLSKSRAIGHLTPYSLLLSAIRFTYNILISFAVLRTGTLHFIFRRR
jgi:hypothetical protein